MKKLNSFSPSVMYPLLIIAFLMMSWNPDGLAQGIEKNLEGKSFAERLWYGGNVNLGFSSGTSSSLFAVGLAPMVGYKVFQRFSAGPRLSLTYSSYKQKYTSQTLKMNTLDYSVGLFTRYKFFTNIFGHFEYGVENVKVPEYDVNGNFKTEGDKIVTESVLLDNLYLGAGYNSGGKFSSEILLLYNFMIPTNSVEQPFEIRVGFTFNF